ncbi:NAD(P)H-quinone oxidoreductase subunit 5 [Halomicrobium zhouii]|uniref:NAD(P)H-quinone oxidoreductase subunit 5 n=1 Tax=Halomicrobium zhouii TaxID=767519 RepID=A0A1I6LUX0_9EURY|nr:proton-conducting transporter membrane subunit [Halomicrobium zhouii]SFS07170.1 NAD(P)H-quinone oxidoreductase subunit 5 [Halomicrobium zhouii]
MAGQTRSNEAVTLSETATQSDSLVPRAATAAVWALFLFSLGVLALTARAGGGWSVLDLFVVDGLTAVVWAVVTFFSGIVHSYSRRYMAGDRYLEGFFGRIFAFTVVVMTMTAADNVGLFVAAWLAMGFLMASLIGHEREWAQAQAAAGTARRYFLASSALLAAGVAILGWTTGATAITGILQEAQQIPRLALLAAVCCLFLAATIQSALFPFHTWLLSSMTAPTPASALMHAGFVNAGGILLTRFAPLLSGETLLLSAIVVVGAFSALLGQAMLLVQTDVKRKLGASTMAQMGFMILQCGLGFFAAAVTHLVLHGFYKAYLFLSSGEAVERTTPGVGKHTESSLARVGVSLLTALGGGVLFAALTGKGTELNSGLFLTFIVVLTTMHATRDILRRAVLLPWLRLVSVPVIVLTAIGAYAALFNAISTIISGAPMSEAPTELTAVHGALAVLFTAAYVATELGWHRSSERLYVALLNVSQPDPDTILTRKEDYDDA